MLHFAGASPMTPAFATLKSPRVMQYHNITPARFFAPFEPGLAREAATSRKELQTLAPLVDLAVGVSEFNRR